ncbi:MAG: hypothetical protein ABI776_04280 [Nocardioidaceae bacterium]
MSTHTSRVGSVLTITGAALGVSTGIVQAVFGSQIPEWSGAKAEPLPLGILTIALSCMAATAALVVRRGANRPTKQVAMLATVVVVALVCFTTVGRLWLVPGPLLLLGAGLQTPTVTEVWTVVRSEAIPALVVALGACELLMAAGATPLPMIVGGLGGAALVTGATLARTHPRICAALLLAGTVPFAVVAWTALVPLLVLVLVAALAAPLLHRSATMPG